MSKRRQGNAVLAGRISVKNKLYLQPEWFPAVGEVVEIRLDDKTAALAKARGVQGPLRAVER
jgi:hypothetical protein